MQITKNILFFISITIFFLSSCKTKKSVKAKNINKERVEKKATQEVEKVAFNVSAEKNKNSKRNKPRQKTKNLKISQKNKIFELTWVGFDFQKKNKQVLIEIITSGNPSYQLISENRVNSAKSLTIRFTKTRLRKKMFYDLDTTEFRSPVSYIKTKENKKDITTDVTLVFREKTDGSLYSYDGDVLLKYKIPEHYFSSDNTKIDKESELKKSSSVIPKVEEGSIKPAKIIEQAAYGFCEKRLASFFSFEDSCVKNLYFKTVSNQDFENQFDDLDDNDYSNNEMNNDNNEMNNDNNEMNNDNNEMNNDNNEMNNDNNEMNNDNNEMNNDNNEMNNDNNEMNNDNNEMNNDNNEMIYNINEKRLESEKDLLPKNENNQIYVKGGEVKVNLEFKDAPLKDVVRALSLESDINFVFKNEIGENRVNINLKNTPWVAALQAVLESNSLGMIKLKDNIVRIDTIENIDNEKKKLREAKKLSSALLPTKVMVIRLSYGKANEIQSVVESFLSAQKGYDKRINIKSDKLSNSLIVEAIPTDLRKIKELVEKIDLRTPQVKVEIRVVEVLKSVNKFLGIDWGGPLRINRGRGLGFGSLIFPNDITSAFSVDTGAAAHTGGSFDTHFGSINNSVELDLRLRLSESLNQTRNLQNASVIVLNNSEAKMQVGKTDIFERDTPMQGKLEPITVEYLLDILVKPIITAEGSIQMNISIKNNSPASVGGGAMASVYNREINTELLRKNGETAVIGGLHTTQYVKTEKGLPFVSKIPILGLFFRSEGHIQDKRELMIMVTPTIVASAFQEKVVNQQNVLNNSININSGNNSNQEDILVDNLE